MTVAGILAGSRLFKAVFFTLRSGWSGDGELHEERKALPGFLGWSLQQVHPGRQSFQDTFPSSGSPKVLNLRQNH